MRRLANIPSLTRKPWHYRYGSRNLIGTQIGIAALETMVLIALSSVALAETRPARTGFQVDIRTGYSLAMGELSKDKALSDATSGQVPLFIDLGGKPIPELFLGGNLGLGVGRSRTRQDLL